MMKWVLNMFDKLIIYYDVNPSQDECLRFMFDSFYRDLESLYFIFSTSLKTTPWAMSPSGSEKSLKKICI